MRVIILVTLGWTLALLGQPAPGKVAGTVTYRQRTALPPTAMVEVTLREVSRADAPYAVIGRQTIELKGRQAPIPFELSYDAAQIDERFSYAVAARITVDGKLVFISDTHHAVITRGASRLVDIVVVPVGGASGRK